MGFEDFSVLVCPKRVSPLYSGNSELILARLSGEVRTKWPQFRLDEVQLTQLEYPARTDEIFLVYETPKGLFQMLIKLSAREQYSIIFSLRFAYCNPRSVYSPFCSVVTWLMKRYEMYCRVMRDLSPEQNAISNEVEEANDVRLILIPSMDYNRSFWQLDAQTEEEATLRPGEAIARFISPHLMNNST